MSYIIEKISPSYDEVICKIIIKVGTEFGAIGEGFGPSDDEVLNMSRHYRAEERAVYFIAKIDGIVVGGGGIASFDETLNICELKKLFLLPEGRGLGIGSTLVKRCLDFARSQGYKQCYLDTLSNMKAAIALYERSGFTHLDKPIGGTIHNSCDVWMISDL